MKSIKREDIHLISQHSNWSQSGIDKTLKQRVYNDQQAWTSFIRIFLVSLGIGFSIAGIIFFFAYNWADLHKFIKIGLIEGLIIGTSIVYFLSKIREDIKNILLTGLAVLVGVLFAVFGQVYQTGANAYDFFFGWTLSITLWAVVANYSVLWLVYITLINTTLFLYSEQVANDWHHTLVLSLLIMVNAFFLFTFLFGNKVLPAIKAPTWLSNVLAIAITYFATIGMIGEIFSFHDRYNQTFSPNLLIFLTIALYALGIAYGLKRKSIFYLSIIPFSIIVIISALLIEASDADAGMLLMTGLFITVSITLLINYLIKLQK